MEDKKQEYFAFGSHKLPEGFEKVTEYIIKGDLKPEVTIVQLLDMLDELIKTNKEQAKIFEYNYMFSTAENKKSAARAYENVKNFIINGSSTNY
jgi:hypothetical protein